MTKFRHGKQEEEIMASGIEGKIFFLSPRKNIWANPVKYNGKTYYAVYYNTDLRGTVQGALFTDKMEAIRFARKMTKKYDYLGSG